MKLFALERLLKHETHNCKGLVCKETICFVLKSKYVMWCFCSVKDSYRAA